MIGRSQISKYNHIKQISHHIKEKSCLGNSIKNVPITRVEYNYE